MTHSKTLFVLLLAVGAFLLPGSVSVPQASADGPIVIRFASVVPSGSAFMKTMKAWNRSLKEQTNNRVELRYYTGGSQGDERDFVRKMRVGQMDAAGVSTTGLGIVARPILVLTAPGLITEYDQSVKARMALTDRFSKLFSDAGFVALSMGEAGKNRIFSANEFARPEDLKSARPWAWKDDPVFAEFVRVIGANPVRMGLGEVYGGLQTRMIDTVPSSAIGAVALQWYTKEKFDELTEHDQQVLINTSVQAGLANDKLVRRTDQNAYDALVKRGITVVDTSAHKAEWDAVAKKTRENLTGRVYSKSLLEAVEEIVASN
jgi:TRAP-type C4-dicarboxylate transport system substrate-binding protein